jgi:hypothetical protein
LDTPLIAGALLPGAPDSFTVNVCPAIVKAPERALVLVFDATE